MSDKGLEVDYSEIVGSNSMMFSITDITMIVNAVRYLSLFQTSLITAIANANSNLPKAAKISKVKVEVLTNTFTDTLDITLMKNDADTTNTINYLASETGIKNNENIIEFTEDDRVCIKLDAASLVGAVTLNITGVIEF